jgi:hypothetical protein
MKKKFGLLALVAAMLLNAVPVLADGDFYVIAGGAAVGTKITSLPITITTSGFYYLTGNLRCANGDAITINIDNVTIDLMGFSITAINGNQGTGIAIHGRNNVEIRNGTLIGWPNGGMYDSTGAGTNYRVFNIRAMGCGIIINGINHLVKGCTVSDTTWYGIIIKQGVISGNAITNCNVGISSDQNATIINNTVSNCTNIGIWGTGGSIIGNSVLCNSGTTGILVSPLETNPVFVDQNTVGGTGTRFAGAGVATVVGKNAGFTYP